MQGTVFDIQRFCVHDGPGIRTTVFMKGCPLRCLWCHNPEGLSPKPQLRFFADKCIGCGACNQRTLLSDAQNCPSQALTVCGWQANEKEILDVVMRDEAYYGSDGGITFSGGECLLQADFVASTLRLAKNRGITTAIDTCGYVSWENIERTLEVCDVYLYDIKCVNAAQHRKYTGVDNALIIDNFEKLCREGKDIWVRVPVIPDFNDTVYEMSRIAELAASASSVKRVTLMPYHLLGAGKYETLGLEYGFNTEKRISDKELSAFVKVFEDKNISVY